MLDSQTLGLAKAETVYQTSTETLVEQKKWPGGVQIPKGCQPLNAHTVPQMVQHIECARKPSWGDCGVIIG